MRQFFTICSFLHKYVSWTKAKKYIPVEGFSMRIVFYFVPRWKMVFFVLWHTITLLARFYATYSLLTLALPTHWDDKKTDRYSQRWQKKMKKLVLLKRNRDVFFGLQRCVRSMVVKITWRLWLAIYLPRSLSSLKVHCTCYMVHFFLALYFVSLSLPPSLLSLSSRCCLSPSRSLPLAGGDGSKGGLCHHQGNQWHCKLFAVT